MLALFSQPGWKLLEDSCETHLLRVMSNCVHQSRTEYDLGRSKGMADVYLWLKNYRHSVETSIKMEREEERESIE